MVVTSCQPLSAFGTAVGLKKKGGGGRGYESGAVMIGAFCTSEMGGQI